jgi:hypothetical protein
MKHLFTHLLLFAFPFIGIAQTPASSQFSSQLKKVMADAPANFNSYKREMVQQKGSDVIYASKMNLYGTTDNKINSLSDGSSYMATVGSAQSENQAKVLVERWKGKLLSILGKGYEVVPYNNSNKESSNEGYMLMGEKNSLTIDYIKYEDEQNYNVYLLILNK